MSFDAIRTASVIRYPCLWARQADSGETEGRKDRPVAVGVRIAREGGDRLLLLPISTSPPGPDRKAIEVPAGGSVSVEPGGFEVVLLGFRGPLREGAIVSLVLEFEHAGEIAVDAEVRPFVDPATLPAA